jgi:hypothetical protein
MAGNLVGHIMSGVTPDELADVMTSAGKPITSAVIRYHCRDPRGMLYGVARRVGRSWQIPEKAADMFAVEWQLYGSLLRRPK